MFFCRHLTAQLRLRDGCQVVRALQLLCGIASARHHYLLPELTRRGLLEVRPAPHTSRGAR
jgi:hypothetical protein